jgi:hypothetical protein
VDRDVATLASFAEKALPLSDAVLHEAYYYRSLGLCVIDAIFSINARYSAVENVVARYCRHFSIERLRTNRECLPAVTDQEPVVLLRDRIVEVGPERFASEVLANRQRTSARSGILKAEAVCRLAQILSDHGVTYFQDVASVSDSAAFERSVRTIPGQASGVSLQYFWMLAGSDNLVKPDRQIVRFAQRALGRDVAPAFAADCLARAAQLLQPKYPHLTPRLLDYEAWRFERAQQP